MPIELGKTYHRVDFFFPDPRQSAPSPVCAERFQWEEGRGEMEYLINGEHRISLHDEGQQVTVPPGWLWKTYTIGVATAFDSGNGGAPMVVLRPKPRENILPFPQS